MSYIFSGTSNSGVFNDETSHPGSDTATLTNSPQTGNPSFWLPVLINGVAYFMPAWRGVAPSTDAQPLGMP